MTFKQLWSILRGRRTNFGWMNASWTYYPDGDPLGKIHQAQSADGIRFMNPTSNGGHIFWGLLCWAGSADTGAWWLGILRFRAILKAPWNAPLFSERYGYGTFVRLGWGWRIRFRLVPHPPLSLS